MAHCHTWTSVPLEQLRHKGHSSGGFTVLINKDVVDMSAHARVET